MTVYFAVPRAEQGTIKIGVTTNVKKRTGSLNGGIPGGVSIVATIPGGNDVEGYLHEKFAQHRMNGEWFRHDDEIKSFVLDVQNNKPGLVPFENVKQFRTKTVKDFGDDAVAQSREMLTAILRHEHRGPGDTIEAAMTRVEATTGLSIFCQRRIRYRQKDDIWAGEYLAIKSEYDALLANGLILSVGRSTGDGR